MLLPMIEQAAAYRKDHTLITADAGYHSDANVEQLMQEGIPALIADNQMRSRDERYKDQGKHKGQDDPLYEKKATGQAKPITLFKPRDFRFHDDDTCTCPAGKTLQSNLAAQSQDCKSCALRGQCLRNPQSRRGRQVSKFEPKTRNPLSASERMKCAIDSARSRRLYSQRIGTVEPVFVNLRHNKRLAPEYAWTR